MTREERAVSHVEVYREAFRALHDMAAYKKTGEVLESVSVLLSAIDEGTVNIPDLLVILRGASRRMEESGMPVHLGKEDFLLREAVHEEIEKVCCRLNDLAEQCIVLSRRFFEIVHEEGK